MRSNNLSDDPEVHRCLVNRVTTDVRNIDRGEKKRNKILHVFFFYHISPRRFTRGSGLIRHDVKTKSLIPLFVSLY